MPSPERRPGPFEPAAVEAFHHLGWDADVRTGEVVLRYALDEHRFEERFRFPVQDVAAGVPSGTQFERAVTVLHVCAGTSYYKAAAPAQVTGIPADLAGFVSDLYLHGLAEFAHTNDLDPIRPHLTTEPVSPDSAHGVAPDGPAVVAVGGGKDSIVTIESARRAGHEFVLASVGTHAAIEATARIAGRPHLVVTRRLDPELLRLNDTGALNGHVPVTAINSAALAVLASLRGASAVVMSNESSASVPITTHRGLPVNHQWSKGLACERWLAALLPVPYFSLLRPLHEVEIARRFAGLEPYFGAVTSCNRAYTAAGRAAAVRWCGACPKCRFVFLALAPFLDPPTVSGIFDGLDLLAAASSETVEAYRGICGVGGTPPLECVGTTRESRWAMLRLAESAAWSDHEVVRALAPELDVVAGWDPLSERGEHTIPAQWQEAADALA